MGQQLSSQEFHSIIERVDERLKTLDEAEQAAGRKRMSRLDRWRCKIVFEYEEIARVKKGWKEHEPKGESRGDGDIMPPPYEECSGGVGNAESAKATVGEIMTTTATMTSNPVASTTTTRKSASPRMAKIKYSDPPKYKWTNKECKAWIYANLVDNLGRERALAAELANLWEGCGPNLWSQTVSWWKSYLGDISGIAISCYLREAYKTECKPHVTFPGYEKKKTTKRET